jgi:ABC-type transport system involved in cytochrome c biogenesis permease subunit
MERVTLLCFAASYAVALGLELWHLFRRRPVHRLLANLFGGAGLLAQSLFLAVQRPPLGGQYGLLLILAWILAVFYLIGSLHHPRLAWGIFVLPVVLGLVALAAAFGPPTDDADRERSPTLAIAHGSLLVLAAVGVCVGFVASVMYLVQAHRLREKMLPGQGVRLPSLERLEMMNRRALTLAFPLLTAGMLLGVVLLWREAVGWGDPRVLASIPLWVVLALLVYLRFGLHLRGRPMAVLTILAFVLLLVTLVMQHTGKGDAA